MEESYHQNLNSNPKIKFEKFKLLNRDLDVGDDAAVSQTIQSSK